MKQSYFHRGGDPPLLGTTIPQHFASIVRRYPENEAVISLPQNQRLTYEELEHQIDRLARGLMALGFGKADRIGIWSTNNIQWLLVQMATARIGAILVNINPAYRSKELAYALKQSSVQCLIAIPRFRSSDYVDMLVELLPQLKRSPLANRQNDAVTSLRAVLLYDPTDPTKTQSDYPGFITWPQLWQAADQIPTEQLEQVANSLDIDDPINIQYTSGTTGFPKAVVLSHHNILNNAYICANALHMDQRDRLCVPVPFYHCFGMVLANLLCLSVGACVVIPSDHFDALAVLRTIASERCTALHGVPTMFIAELEHPRFNEFDLSSLRTGIMAGAPCPPALMKRVMQEMHCAEILIGYGQTEASPITHLTSKDDSLERRTETVGTNLPHLEVKIVDTQTGSTVPFEQVGEVCFRGYQAMKGYYSDPDATAKAIDKHGWLHSGDLGCMDSDGYLRITGRLKEMIIRGGENIYPREIEDLIFSHPKVAQVAVIGVPDDYYGEQIAAWIQLHPSQSASEDEIREFCKDKIAHFKIPAYIRFVDQFPMTVTGKLQKFRMRQTAINEISQSRRNIT